MKNNKWTYGDRQGRGACALDPLARNISLGYLTGIKSSVLVSRIYPLGPRTLWNGLQLRNTQGFIFTLISCRQ